MSSPTAPVALSRACRATTVPGGLVWRYHGDAAWEHGDLGAPGRRRRMWMVPGAWRYEEDLGADA